MDYQSSPSRPGTGGPSGITHTDMDTSKQRQAEADAHVRNLNHMKDTPTRPGPPGMPSDAAARGRQGGL